VVSGAPSRAPVETVPASYVPDAASGAETDPSGDGAVEPVDLLLHATVRTTKAETSPASRERDRNRRERSWCLHEWLMEIP
jgi:hypothetical protein